MLTIGAINGGTTYNVIPPRVALKGTVRTFGEATRAEMEGRIRRIAEHTCAAANATCALHWHPSYPVTANDPHEAAFVRETLAAALGEERVVEIPPLMGSEDFAYMAEVVPAAYAWIGNGVEGKGNCMVHNPGYDFNDDILAIGASYWVRLTEAYLAD